MSVFKRPGADTYSYDFRIRGRRFSGSTGCKTKRAAERWEQDEKDRVKGSEIDTAKPLTFAQASSLYWHEVGQHHQNADDTERSLAWLTEQIGGKTMLADIGDALVARLVAKRRGEKVSNATVNRSVTEPLCAILRRASGTWKAKVQDITWKTHFLKEPKERVREASKDEEAKMMEDMRDDYGPALQFALLTGCRRAEIVGLQWTSVDFINRLFRVVGKGDKERLVPMTQEVFDLLWSLKDHHKSAVFTYIARKTRDGRVRGTRYPITDAGFKTQWRRGPRSNLVDFRFHDTRHTAATRLVRATGNIRLAQRLLGHTEIATTTKYAHVTNEDLRAGLEAASTTATKNATQSTTRKMRKAAND